MKQIYFVEETLSLRVMQQDTSEKGLCFPRGFHLHGSQEIGIVGAPKSIMAGLEKTHISPLKTTTHQPSQKLRSQS